MKYIFSYLGLLLSSCLVSQTYDIVLMNGRVMDPETGFDGIRNIGIQSGRIAEISDELLIGKETIDVSGYVVSPGFIDLHVHGMTNRAHQYQARDGVTTALELESGVAMLDAWIDSKRGKTLVNYGASVAHGTLRALAMPEYAALYDQARNVAMKDGIQSMKYQALMANTARSGYRSLSMEHQANLDQIIDQVLSEGALGIGIPVGYYPGATQAEIFRVYQFAAKRKVPIFSHTRGFGLVGIQEAIANATTSGASLHIVHANSLSLGDIQTTLDMVSSAQAQGLDITTEIYPYTAASTSLQSALFDDGWQEELGISYEDLQWETTGERLTSQTFNTYREQGGIVIIHMMKPEWITAGMKSPVTMIGSDGMPYAPKAHPRTAGTFARVLGKYVREEQVISLMDALTKMTIMPAKRLEPIAPVMTHKGRMQIGADADITIFDPSRVIDMATFEGLDYSQGIDYVMVNGQWIVKEGNLVPDVFPGQPIVSKYKRN